MKKSLQVVLLAAAVAALAVSPAAAASFTITDIDAAFVNPVPSVTINNGDPNHITARWGVPAGGTGQSGYNFDSTVPPIINGIVPPTTGWFLLGNFTHLNQPITGDSLDHIGLNVIADFSITNGANTTTFNNTTFAYTLTHDETTNSAPCPNFQQSNVACDDLVTISNPSAGIFNVGGTNFSLQLGFSKDGGATIINQFVTTEGLTNVAGLWGRFSSDDVVVNPLAAVPEPASLMLLGSGLLAATRGLRRFKR